MTQRVVALNFHDVTANGHSASAENDPWYRIQAAELERLLAELRRRGFQTVSSRVFRAWQQGERKLPERTVVLTFDDGYASHFEVVVPLLVRYRFSGTFFIPTDHIGTPGHMTWDQLRRLVFVGMEIGSHGKSHRPLTELPPEEMVRELRESREVLESRLGTPVRALSAPRGFWSGSVAAAVQAAGYEAAWVSTIGTNGRETSPIGLRRIVVRGQFSVDRIVAMVEGWQPAFWWAASHQAVIRTLKRVLGVYRYEQLKRLLVPNA
jgi:peptidoglycan/xylan/chitin deacetylase (PgdA/CDA1 family)